MFICFVQHLFNSEVKISPRQRQHVRERNHCVLTSSFLVFLFVIVVDDEMEAMSPSSLCVHKRNENDSDISVTISNSLS